MTFVAGHHRGIGGLGRTVWARMLAEEKRERCICDSIPLKTEGLLTQMQYQRTLSKSIATVAATLEMRQSRVVNHDDIASILGVPAGARLVENTIERLVERGWLRRLPLRGTYEFLPAAGGPWESGDPWIELRAALASYPELKPQVALASAAYLQGLADRHPVRDLIAVNKEVSLPPGLHKTYKVIRTTPARLFGAAMVDALPVSTPARLVLEAAMWWQHAGDLRNPEHWLHAALAAASVEELREGARHLGGGVTARTGYLADRFGNRDIADSLLDLPRARPVFLGPRPTSVAEVPFNPRWGIYDTLTLSPESPE